MVVFLPGAVFSERPKDISVCVQCSLLLGTFCEHERVRACVIGSSCAEAIWVCASLVYLVLASINIYDWGLNW